MSTMTPDEKQRLAERFRTGSKQQKKTIDLYLDEDLLRRLTDCARRIGIARNQLLTGMVREKVSEIEKMYEEASSRDEQSSSPYEGRTAMDR